MEPIIEYILNNKEWLFSGIGVAVIGGLLTLWSRKITQKSQTARVKRPTGPVTIVQASDKSEVKLANIERHPANIQVVGVNIVETEECPQVLDVKIRNAGDEVAYVKRVEFETLGHWVINSDRLASLREVSADYDIIVDRTMSSICSLNISHEVKPQETDRIQIKLSTDSVDDPLGLSLFLLAGSLYFNEDDQKANIPLVLTDIRRPDVVLGSYFGGYRDETVAKNKQTALKILEAISSPTIIQDEIVEALESWVDAPDE